jgi:hypothetical protein
MKAVLVFLALATAAHAGPFRHRQHQRQTTAAPQALSVCSNPTDPAGFTAWLNGERAKYGLRAVVYDANLAGWCHLNNLQQLARGLGHFIIGPARRQNSGMGPGCNMGAMWMNSPAHRAALLDPTITTIGISGHGQWWTFSAY